MTNQPATTRQRLVRAMMQALRTKGFHGIGLNELLASAEAPKGVLYHHFPGGKTELAIAAIEEGTVAMAEKISQSMLRSGNLANLILKWFGSAADLLAARGYEQGCPLATVALETTESDAQLRVVLAQSFIDVRAAVAQALQSHGFDEARANSLAMLVVSAYEGALIQARVAHSPEPLLQAAKALAPLLSPPASARASKTTTNA